MNQVTGKLWIVVKKKNLLAIAALLLTLKKYNNFTRNLSKHYDNLKSKIKELISSKQLGSNPNPVEAAERQYFTRIDSRLTSATQPLAPVNSIGINRCTEPLMLFHTPSYLFPSLSLDRVRSNEAIYLYCLVIYRSVL